MVTNHTSFLLLHALFALVDHSVETLKVLFSTTLLDIFMYMDRDWSTLVNAIEKGVIPEFDHIENVRENLEVNTDFISPTDCTPNETCSDTCMPILSVPLSYVESDHLPTPPGGQNASGQI